MFTVISIQPQNYLFSSKEFLGHKQMYSHDGTGKKKINIEGLNDFIYILKQSIQAWAS